MLLKIVGSLIVFVSCTLLGYSHAQTYAQRPQELKTLQMLLQIFENEISFLSNVLQEAFQKVSSCTDSSVAVFFEAAVENLKEGLCADEAWTKAVKENISGTSLNSEDEAIIISFGKMLGSSDLEGQIKNIRLTVNQLKIQEQKAEELRSKNEKMFKSLGVLCGLAIIILLF
ncbi:stage III sporulation protein SpoIIIAB [Acetivibrio clariflavus]|uniref:Stage III sporulation protein AB n=1 Tax=Acetivibrio clariflavus (strain DSM 19732 / NBRC 101661 / EBR45) TaxID=720554 RepID=G8LWK3_ACECE|nr:stage III sporulation protein SpoIIIAB [Acetivibrio clariflavus]AEV68671.1 stage III sporulation protein AB [Acetivibrio clariflavus DSM 19732]